MSFNKICFECFQKKTEMHIVMIDYDDIKENKIYKTINMLIDFFFFFSHARTHAFIYRKIVKIINERR